MDKSIGLDGPAEKAQISALQDTGMNLEKSVLCDAWSCRGRVGQPGIRAGTACGSLYAGLN